MSERREQRFGMPSSQAFTLAGTMLADRQQWTQRALARTATGDACDPSWLRARRWSIDGIMYRVHNLDPDDYDAPRFNACASDFAELSLCASRLFKEPLTVINDDPDQDAAHAAILQILRLAVRRARVDEAERQAA